MSESPDETPAGSSTGAGGLNESLVAFAGCVGQAIEDICSYGLTIGDSYVPFDPDPEDECDEEDSMCSQVWVRVTDVTANVVDAFGTDCASTLSIGLEVGVIRCIEVEGKGEAPTSTQVLAAAIQSMEDMNALYCAAMSCDVWDSIDAGQWQPFGPDGGQYGGTWTFEVERS